MAKHQNTTKAALIAGILLTAAPAFAFDSPPPRTAAEAAHCAIAEAAYYKHQVARYGADTTTSVATAIDRAIIAKCALAPTGTNSQNTP